MEENSVLSIARNETLEDSIPPSSDGRLDELNVSEAMYASSAYSIERHDERRIANLTTELSKHAAEIDSLKSQERKRLVQLRKLMDELKRTRSEKEEYQRQFEDVQAAVSGLRQEDSLRVEQLSGENEGLKKDIQDLAVELELAKIDAKEKAQALRKLQAATVSTASNTGELRTQYTKLEGMFRKERERSNLLAKENALLSERVRAAQTGNAVAVSENTGWSFPRRFNDVADAKVVTILLMVILLLFWAVT